MKEITLFTEDEKEIIILLLKAKKQGNYEAAVRFAEMIIEGCERALAEYKVHPKSEEVTSDFLKDDEFHPETVADKITEIEKVIAENEEWLKNAKMMKN